MNKKSVNAHSPLSMVILLLGIALAALALGGCANTPATSGPGTPDEMQLGHYNMVKSAIEAKSKPDALAALALMQADVSRWRTNIAVVMKAFVDLGVITDAVAEENWATADKLFQELTVRYRNP